MSQLSQLLIATTRQLVPRAFHLASTTALQVISLQSPDALRLERTPFYCQLHREPVNQLVNWARLEVQLRLTKMQERSIGSKIDPAS
jgi:hypothetical protein